MDNKIPKIIHYCWFGGKPLPYDLQKCVDTWSKLEGYQIIRWDESNCNFDENEFVRKTYAEKKLGFIGDYYRLKAVYEYGGIYMDTDVAINKSFDELLEYPAFLNFIFDCSVGTAIIGAQKGNQYIKGMLDMYNRSVFEPTDNGNVFQERGNTLVVNDITSATSNYYHTYYILKHYPNFLLNNKFQNCTDFVIFPKELFEIGTLSGKHYAVHLCAGEWRVKTEGKKSLKDRIKESLQNTPRLYDKVQVLVRKRRYRRLNKEIPFYSYYLAQKKHTRLPEL